MIAIPHYGTNVNLNDVTITKLTLTLELAQGKSIPKQNNPKRGPKNIPIKVFAS